MLEELLVRDEGKTLEFKENTLSLQKIIQTIIAFANTAGGTLIVGVQDKTKEVIGLQDIQKDEEKIANAVAESIEPLLIPTFHRYTWRKRDVLIIVVDHSFGPYYLKAKGIEHSTFMRLGSTNRPADLHMIEEIRQSKQRRFFDGQPNAECPLDRIQFDLAKQLFEKVHKSFSEQTAQSLDLIVKYQGKPFPSNAAVLLFGRNPKEFFPDAMIRLGRFIGLTKAEILDHKDLEIPISIALDPIVDFIKRHTSTAAKFGEMRRIDIPEYNTQVVREAIINALLHTDYSIQGASITVAIFDDRIEVTNPGALPLGLTLDDALNGISLLRNKVIGNVFRELDLIERWGSGLGRMIQISKQQGVQPPKFEERGTFFRATLYNAPRQLLPRESWQLPIIEFLKEHVEISPKQAQDLWEVSDRTATKRLKQMVDEGLLVELATSAFDPYKTFKLPQSLLTLIKNN